MKKIEIIFKYLYIAYHYNPKRNKTQMNYTPLFVENADALFDTILQNTQWNKINYFKRHVSHYQFNVKELNDIFLNIETQFSRQVTGAFLNYYEDGNEYAPYHADKYNCDSCLISLGTTRTLRYKENTTKENTDYILNNGDLLYIPDEINNNYKHSLLKTKKVDTPRISILVFLK